MPCHPSAGWIYVSVCRRSTELEVKTPFVVLVARGRLATCSAAAWGVLRALASAVDEQYPCCGAYETLPLPCLPYTEVPTHVEDVQYLRRLLHPTSLLGFPSRPIPS